MNMYSFGTRSKYPSGHSSSAFLKQVTEPSEELVERGEMEAMVVRLLPEEEVVMPALFLAYPRFDVKLMTFVGFVGLALDAEAYQPLA